MMQEKFILNKENNLKNYLYEGENLTILKYLLNNNYKEKVDFIYIDPPYNTGKTFTYKDKCFSNIKDKHKNWSSFMKERLILTRELLKDTGLIFISIDEFEFAYLKILCDEVFEEENFIENFIWIKNSTKNNSKTTSTNHEYILCFAKDIKKIKSLGTFFKEEKQGCNEILEFVKKCKKEKKTPKEVEKLLKNIFKNKPEWKGISAYKYVDENYKVFSSGDMSAPSNGPKYEIIHPLTKKSCKTPLNGYRFSKESVPLLIKENRILFGKDEKTVVRYKRFLEEVKTDIKKSIITNNFDGKKDLEKVLKGVSFDNPKPVSLIKDLIKMVPTNDILVLDFFAGSGTTGQAVIELNKEDKGNRQFILCTNNENNICEEITYKRLIIVIDKENLTYLKENEE